MKLPPLHALRAFDTVARLGGVRAAAQALFVTPGAVTQQLRTLEAYFGLALVERRGRGIVVTDAGRTLHGRVEELTDKLAEPAYADLSDQSLEELAGVLGACAADVAASGLLPFPNPMGLPRPPER